jgi:hypothetical protein
MHTIELTWPTSPTCHAFMRQVSYVISGQNREHLEDNVKASAGTHEGRQACMEMLVDARRLGDSCTQLSEQASTYLPLAWDSLELHMLLQVHMAGFGSCLAG